MKEVEVKARVKDLEALKDVLEREQGFLFGEVVTQEDHIYMPNGTTNFLRVLGRNVLRIREEGKRTLFTLKQSQENELDALEYEVEVDDAEALDRIICTLGFTEWIRVKKVRRSAKKGEITITLDDVEGLGQFVEMERIVAEDSDSVKIQDELFAFLKQLGMTDSNREMCGYDTLMYEKQSGQ